MSIDKRGKLTQGDNNPRKIETDEIDPKVQKLRASTADAVKSTFDPVCHVIEGNAIQMCRTKHSLGDVTPRSIGENSKQGKPAKRAPGELI